MEQMSSTSQDKSPMQTLSQLGSTSFEEPLGRHRALHQEYEDRREERRRNGVIKFRLEPGVPDVGGLGWRSKTGHELKNQAFFASKSGENSWNNPSHAGTHTWKAYHGPKLRTDAPMMERLDRMDEEEDKWDAKKTFVNTVRVQTLDRFYNRKLQNEQFKKTSSWAPHRRAKSEVHQHLECFGDEIDSMPIKDLKKVLTPMVLKNDREAIRMITKRFQKEETWKSAWRQMEVERRHDILEDFKQRQIYNDMLMQMSGQPRRCHDSEHHMPNNCTSRVEELALPKEDKPLPDVTNLNEYHGLVHVDHAHALEALYPGRGYEESHEFRRRATVASRSGWPPPERPQTPEKPAPGAPRKSVTNPSSPLKRASIPASQFVVDQAAGRVDDLALLASAKEQYSFTEAPPAPDQRKSMLKRDWTPETTMLDPSCDGSPDSGRKSLIGKPAAHTKAKESIPPPLRQLTYPVVAPTADLTREATAERLRKRGTAVEFADETSTAHGAAKPGAFQVGPHRPSSSMDVTHRRIRAQGMASAKAGFAEAEQTTGTVCDALDDFEAKAAQVLKTRAGTTSAPWQDDF